MCVCEGGTVCVGGARCVSEGAGGSGTWGRPWGNMRKMRVCVSACMCVCGVLGKWVDGWVAGGGAC